MTSNIDKDLTHVLTNVLKRGVDHPVTKAFKRNGIIDMGSLFSLSQDDVKALTFKEKVKQDKYVEKHLIIGDRNLIFAFQAYADELLRNNLHLKWVDLTADAFDVYRIEQYRPNITKSPPPSLMKQTATQASTTGKTTAGSFPDFK